MHISAPMRKITILFFIVLSTTVFSQSHLKKPEIYVGATFGASESMVMFKPTVTQGFLQGYNGGLVFRYVADKNVGFQVEMNLSQRGWSEKTGLYTRQLNYIELPFLTHFYFGNNSRFFFNIGPKISYLISEKNLINTTTASSEVQHITKIQNPFDYGVSAGFGYLINIKGNIIQLDTRANYSLSDIFSNDTRDYFDTSNNLYLSVNLAWLLKIK
jgi:hypothetical protein